MVTRTGIAAFGLLAVLSGSTSAFAQGGSSPATGRAIITIADPSGGVIPGATVRVSPENGAGAAGASVSTSPAGVAVIEGLTPGRYSVTAEFPGFEAVTVRDFRVRTGDSRRTIVLPLKKVAEDVTVGRDRQTSAVDPRGDAFSTVLTREQIERLPDDPDEMEAALKAMAPPGSLIRVDGFTGGKLPPKSQIRSIRLPRMDNMAAQNHGGMNGMMHIDIMTQPGTGPVRGSLDAAVRDDALNAANPFVPVKGDEGMRQAGLSLNGALVPNRASFSMSVQQARLFDTSNILAALPDGQTVAAATMRPTYRWNTYGRYDQATTPGHMLRFWYQGSSVDVRNQGVGSFDLPERAYSTSSTDHMLRVSENGPVGRRGFWESRVQVRLTSASARSAVDAPTIQVLDAFTSGGAQRRGGSRATDVEAASDFDYVRGAHSSRAGILIEAGRYRSDDGLNYLGTYTFASLEDYSNGRATNYSRRIGDPTIRYSNVQLGVYAQDDYRLRKSLMLSYGIRYETQRQASAWHTFSPRATLTWSPLKNGRTTFRAGAGWFSDWLAAGIYEQTLRVDGVRQQELNIHDPAYPDPGSTVVATPSNRYQLSSGLQLPASLTTNLGIDQALTGALRLVATWTYRNGRGALRGRNLNVPVDGVRPDPRFSNVIDVVGDAAARQHLVSLNLNFIKLEWHQAFLSANYTWASSATNTTGPFSPPAIGDDLAAEWATVAPTHRVGGMFNMRPTKSIGVSATFRAQSGGPYTITTGRDDNLDGVFNDRPAGVGRNSARTAAQWDLGLRVSYTLGFGQRASSGGGPTMIMIGGSGGGMPGGGVSGGASDDRFRLEFYAAAQNVTNHNNYIGYSGVLTSPFFGQPTNVMNPRKIELGVRFGF